jgi:hypothetical protein
MLMCFEKAAQIVLFEKSGMKVGCLFGLGFLGV